MSALSLAERLDLTVAIAREAGRMIVTAREQQGFGHRYKLGDELVTDVDVQVDTFIKQRLNAAFPDDAILSEELSPQADGLAEAEALWVVDPIDGTVNFAHGLRHVAVSIAWAVKGETQLGVVHAPFLEETFTGMLGQGAFCNQQPIRASQASELSRALVATGFPHRRSERAALIQRLTATLNHCQDVRRNGSAALDLCDVACGRLDAYYESVSPWDSAAGWLIAREAGATVSHRYPCPKDVPPDLYSKHLLVTAPDIHQALEQLLREADGAA
ncbi:inositol monophosphatase family protein [Vreelandella rituensis]|uniref:Inositol-1-monophosphatase n=1 Tax=Vreelandella rituensis TaxID=2282306 RepID=A0A368U607_9GAMM|nr:inositol monophosphatase family protein [Halomonas rituensis]RCV92568.1 inositol monophosphatase [Halomonas rituensis]